ncbi:MAG TPA: undecaprenyl-diphosphatase UppP [Candidatus Limnocylindrales bacterium]|nr:undecaprenyl-diphosphatase UppP [Candidatus Limnocylindrales bacterium]
MDTVLQALVLGIVQGLTEFLPISSSGHLILVPALLGWDDPFIDSLTFSVMLHLGTLGALLVYFWRDWLRLVPAGLATIRDRSFASDPDRRLAWLIVATMLPAIVVGVLFDDFIEANVRTAGTVAVLLLIGAAILWVCDHVGGTDRRIADLTFPQAFGIGVAQAAALFPGVSRSGISISAGRLFGLERSDAARFSFLMAAPIIAGAGAWETLKLIRDGSDVAIQVGPLVAGMIAAFVSGLLAIAFLLRWLASHPLDIFVWYRVALAAVVIIALFAGRV